MRALLVGIAIMLFVMTLGSSALAQSDIGLYGIGGRLGLVMPEDPIDNTFGLGIHADLGTITKDIHFEALIDYWSKSYKTGFESLEASISEIVLGAAAKYFFQTSSKIEPYLGGGFGLAIGKGKVELKNPVTSEIEEDSSSETGFGLMFLGGLEYPLSPTLTGLAELKYFVSLSDEIADYFGVYVGITYPLGR